jgi:hypothetical protein
LLDTALVITNLRWHRKFANGVISIGPAGKTPTPVLDQKPADRLLFMGGSRPRIGEDR